MKRALVQAGKAVAAGGLTGAILYLIATVPTHTHIYWPYWIFGGMIAAGSGLYVAGQERIRHIKRPPSMAPEHDQEPSLIDLVLRPPIFDRWLSAMEGVSSEILQLRNNSLSHPGYALRHSEGSPPPSVRIGMMVACTELDAQTPPTSDIRARFVSFLGQPPTMDLVRGLTEVDPGLSWLAFDDNPRHNFAAILSRPGVDDAPIAWARLLAPDAVTRRYGRDNRCAYLVLYVEPRTTGGAVAPPASLAEWHQLLSQSLSLPAALAAFLREQLELSTPGEPAAETGVWLEAPRGLTQLVEVNGFESVPGSAQSLWFMGFAEADAAGQQPHRMAVAWLRQMCDSALHLDDYESALDSLATDRAVPRLEVTVGEPAWESWRRLEYIVALPVNITNTTSARIRLASSGLGVDWAGQPPGDLPVLGEAENRAADREVEALRDHRYSPDLRSFTHIEAGATITGWLVARAGGRPDLGGTPQLTLSVREAAGHQYLTVIPRTEPQVYKS
jgi:hypothetical protein